MKLAIVIPAYNEEKTVASIIKQCKKYSNHIIVVDDASSDNTESEALHAGATVLTHLVNLGLGGAIKTGSDFACNKGFDIIVHIDADGQHYPSDLPKALNLLKKNKLDIVFGSRFITENERPFVKLVGNYFLNIAFLLLWGIPVTDSQTGFRVMTTDSWKEMDVNTPGYEVSSRIVCEVKRKGLKYGEAPIKSIYNDKFKGTTILDGIRIFFNMLWWRVFP
jgi:glycosyltransferase involved in cell wall biosynthesis